jgi:probable rRNA maturation factor
MKIFLNNFKKLNLPISENQIAKILNRVIEEAKLKIEDFENKELSISCVSEEESKVLNKKYRGKNKPTNVLSFSVNEHLTKNFLIGDIILCTEIIKKEAKEYSKNFENRLKHMIIHGFLHLLSFNHEENHERIKMEELEKIIMNKISAGEPY